LTRSYARTRARPEDARYHPDLKSGGINAEGTIREADYGHLARKILAVASLRSITRSWGR